MSVKIIQRNKKDFYFFSILKSLFASAKRAFQNLNSAKSSKNTIKNIEYRGIHRLEKWEDGSEKCIACCLCETICPTKSIFIEPQERFDGKAVRRPKKFKINLLECIFCGYCVDACLQDAIKMDTDIFSFNASRKEDFILNKKRLMFHKAGYKKEEDD